MCAHAPHSNHKLELGDFFLRVLKKNIFQFTKKVLCGEFSAAETSRIQCHAITPIN